MEKISPIGLIVFDFDGTLADTRELIIQTNFEVQRKMGYPLTTEEEIVATVGLPLKECFLVMYPDMPADDMPVCIKLYRQIFDELKGQIVPTLFPHVRETLDTLAGRGLSFSVASSRSTPSLLGFLRDMDLARYISFVVGADDVMQAKPHPEPVLNTLRELSFSASETMVVGDMPVDIQMGLAAGASTCGVSYGNSSREVLLAAGADSVIDDFAELSALVRG